MFFLQPKQKDVELQLKPKDIERLTKISEEKGAPVERLARLMFLKGLRSYVNPTRHILLEEIHDYIRGHWKQETDEQIGTKFGYSSSSIRLFRLRLGLKKKTREGKIDRSGVDREKFEHMLTHEGYTLTDYAQLELSGCSREYVRQLAEEMGVKHSLSDRVPEWSLTRKARQLGNPNLANRDWLTERVAKAVSIASLAAELAINQHDLYFFVQRFGIVHPWKRRRLADAVELTCAHCAKKFLRLKSSVDRRKKISAETGEPLEFFCSMRCTGKYNRERAKQRRKRL